MDMILHSVSNKQFSHYSEYRVTMGGLEYNSNILVYDDSIIKLNIRNINELTIAFFESNFSTPPDLILVGCSQKIMYPNIAILNFLQHNSIGIECMTIQALCRTFNFLVSEERHVAGMLFFE